RFSRDWSSDVCLFRSLLFVCTNCSSSSRTVTTFQISGATAAAFSPDNLKAYILAGNKLYVYSKLDPLQTIDLGGAGNDVAFHPRSEERRVGKEGRSRV